MTQNPRVGIIFPKEFLEKIDAMWKKKGYPKRTAFVLEACRRLLEEHEKEA